MSINTLFLSIFSILYREQCLHHSAVHDGINIHTGEFVHPLSFKIN